MIRDQKGFNLPLTPDVVVKAGETLLHLLIDSVASEHDVALRKI